MCLTTHYNGVFLIYFYFPQKILVQTIVLFKINVVYLHLKGSGNAPRVIRTADLDG